MNKVQKLKGALIAFGVILLALCILCVVFGVTLVSQARVLPIVFGVLLFVVGLLLLLFSIYFIWLGVSQKATQGSLKEDNLASSGTVNVKLCSKCGNELQVGADFCHKCGQTASSCKVCDCGAENNMQNTRCTSCGKEI